MTVLEEAWKATSLIERVGLQGISPLAADIRVMAHHLIKCPWKSEGENTVLYHGDFELRAMAQGFPRPFEIFVLVQRTGDREVLWHRRLGREEGEEPVKWLESSLLAGHQELLKLTEAR